MSALYVTEQNSILRKRGGRLVVEKEGERLLSVPLGELDTVLLFGNVQFTTQAAVALLDRGIELALLSRRGRLRGQLTPPKAKNVELRLAQFRRLDDGPFCLDLARTLVAGKIANAAALLRRYRANHPDALPAAEVDALAARAAGLAGAATLDAVRGVEGAAARHYFRLYAALVPAELGFSGRNRRPPRDPVNALLSFGYVLVGAELQALVDGMGFDPYLGFLHRPDYGRPSLALDLLEEMRPAVVDRLTSRWLNLGTLGADDFTTSSTAGVLLDREPMKRYLAAYEGELTRELAVDGETTSLRRLFRRQAQRLARTVQQGEPYEPFALTS